jgi:hypothetical protein
MSWDVVWQKVSKVSEESAISIFRVKVEGNEDRPTRPVVKLEENGATGLHCVTSQ